MSMQKITTVCYQGAPVLLACRCHAGVRPHRSQVYLYLVGPATRVHQLYTRLAADYAGNRAYKKRIWWHVWVCVCVCEWVCVLIVRVECACACVCACVLGTYVRMYAHNVCMRVCMYLGIIRYVLYREGPVNIIISPNLLEALEVNTGR